MVAVAIVGLICGGEMCRRRQKLLTARSNLHMVKEIFYENKRQYSLSMQHYLKISPSIPNELRTLRRRNQLKPTTDREIEENQRAIDSSLAATRYHARMKEKYRQAARHPWLPVEPDPPEPE